MSGTPILLNGRYYSVAVGLVEAIKPEYDGKTFQSSLLVANPSQIVPVG